MNTTEAPIPVETHSPDRRYRSFPRPTRLVLDAALLFLAFVCFVGFAFELLALLLTQNSMHAHWALGLLAAFGSFRLAAFFNHRHLLCPLCHGPVLHDRNCRKHSTAVKLPGLSYRANVVASIILNACFRCMYCGTGFRLRK